MNWQAVWMLRSAPRMKAHGLTRIETDAHGLTSLDPCESVVSVPIRVPSNHSRTLKVCR